MEKIFIFSLFNKFIRSHNDIFSNLDINFNQSNEFWKILAIFRRLGRDIMYHIPSSNNSSSVFNLLLNIEFNKFLFCNIGINNLKRSYRKLIKEKIISFSSFDNYELFFYFTNYIKLNINFSISY